MNNSVCFSGYRPHKFNFSQENKRLICQKLVTEISTCAKYGCTAFFFGGAPGFDLLAARMVLFLKRIFDIELICALPYEDFHLSKEFGEDWRRDYLQIIEKCDKVVNIGASTAVGSDPYMARNRFMVDNSGILICLHDGKGGGTRNTIDYAREKGLKIINILPV